MGDSANAGAGTSRIDAADNAVEAILSTASRYPAGWKILGNWYIQGAIGALDVANLLAKPDIGTAASLRTSLRDEVANPINGLNRIEANVSLDPFGKPYNRSALSQPAIDSFSKRLRAGLRHLSPTMPRIVALGEALLGATGDHRISAAADRDAVTEAVTMLYPVTDREELATLKKSLAANDTMLQFGSGGIRVMSTEEIRKAASLDLFGYGRGKDSVSKNRKKAVSASAGYEPPAPSRSAPDKKAQRQKSTRVASPGGPGRKLELYPLFAEGKHSALLAALKEKRLDTLTPFLDAYVAEGTKESNARPQVRELLNGKIQRRTIGALSIAASRTAEIVQQPVEALFPEYRPRPAKPPKPATQPRARAEKPEKIPVDEFAGLRAAHPAVHETLTAQYQSREQIAEALVAAGSAHKRAIRQANNVGKGRLTRAGGRASPALLAVAKLVPIDLAPFGAPPRQRKPKAPKPPRVKAERAAAPERKAKSLLGRVARNFRVRREPGQAFAECKTSHPDVHARLAESGLLDRRKLAAAFHARGYSEATSAIYAGKIGAGRLTLLTGEPSNAFRAIAPTIGYDLAALARSAASRPAMELAPTPELVSATVRHGRDVSRADKRSVARIPGINGLFNALLEPLQANGVTHMGDIKIRIARDASIDRKLGGTILRQIEAGTFIGLGGRPTPGLRFLSKLACVEVPETLATLLPGRLLRPVGQQNTAG